MDKNTIIKKVQKNSLLRALDQASLERLVDAADVIAFRAGDLIIREDDINPNIFFIVSGTVNIDVSGKEKEVYLCSMGAGEFVGEAGIFLALKRNANVKAASESLLLRFSRENFHAFLREKPAAGIKVLMIIIYSLLKKLSTANSELAFERQFDISQDDVDEIIRNFL